MFSDSMLIINQVTGEFQAKEERMVKYLKKVRILLEQFMKHRVTQIPRAENIEADALTRLASGSEVEGIVLFPLKRLDQPNIEREEQVLCSKNTVTWMDPIVQYLRDSQLPEDQEEARMIKTTSARYTLINDKLYR